jgi:Smg protein
MKFMFDILVYLYETYYRPDTCPDSIVLAKKLSAVGFDDDEIIAALDWLRGLADTTNHLAIADLDALLCPASLLESTGFRVYTEEENALLGSEAIGYLHFLQDTEMLNAQQREIVIERAMAVDESPLSLAKFKVIVLMILWSQGCESDMLMFDELLLSDAENCPRLLQ